MTTQAWYAALDGPEPDIYIHSRGPRVKVMAEIVCYCCMYDDSLAYCVNLMSQRIS